jgi:ubiquinone/menaquinone biosynthesis C-methylase UbiE
MCFMWPGYARDQVYSPLISASGSSLRAGHRLDPALEAEWDRRCDGWEQVAASAPFIALRDAVLAEAAIEPGQSVVDLGSGTGLLALSAAGQAVDVLAIDVSAPMLQRLAEHAAERGLTNIELVHGDIRRLPLPDESVDVVVSCYAFHHLVDDGKELAAAEVFRVLRPGGRLVVADMMFQLSIRARDRRIILQKVRLMLRRGVPGVVRLVKNAARIVGGRWEHPASTMWWETMLARRGFVLVGCRELANEAGIAFATKPHRRAPA